MAVSWPTLLQLDEMHLLVCACHAFGRHNLMQHVWMQATKRTELVTNFASGAHHTVATLKGI